jgi:hypothetical protein
VGFCWVLFVVCGCWLLLGGFVGLWWCWGLFFVVVGFVGLFSVYCGCVANYKRDVPLSVDDCLEMRDLWVYFDCLGAEYRFNLHGLADMFGVGSQTAQKVLSGEHALLSGLGLGSVLLFGVEADVRRAEFWALRDDVMDVVVDDVMDVRKVHWSMWFKQNDGTADGVVDDL